MLKKIFKTFTIALLTVLMLMSALVTNSYASQVTLSKVKVSSLKVSDKKFTVKYSKVKNAKGYQISYRKVGSSNWSNKNVSAKTTSVTIKNLTRGKKYYVKVRAYNTQKVTVSVAKANSEEQEEEVTTTQNETYYGSYSDTKTANILTLRKIKENKIVSIAKSKLGCKYRYGSTGPNTFDCSGFTRYVLKKAINKTIPRTSGSQKSGGKRVSIKNLKVGDIVWRSGHVGLYVGNGKVIHSPHTGDVVRYTKASKFKCGVRYF